MTLLTLLCQLSFTKPQKYNDTVMMLMMTMVMMMKKIMLTMKTTGALILIEFMYRTACLPKSAFKDLMMKGLFSMNFMYFVHNMGVLCTGYIHFLLHAMGTLCINFCSFNKCILLTSCEKYVIHLKSTKGHQTVRSTPIYCNQLLYSFIFCKCQTYGKQGHLL